jgi:hypothetical protein
MRLNSSKACPGATHKQALGTYGNAGPADLNSETHTGSPRPLPDHSCLSMLLAAGPGELHRFRWVMKRPVTAVGEGLLTRRDELPVLGNHTLQER